MAPIERIGGFTRGSTHPRANSLGKTNWSNKEGGVHKSPDAGPREKFANIGKKLSQVELQERSKKGLCFKYGE